MSNAIKRINLSAGASTRQVVETFIAGEAIAIGNIVKFDVDATGGDSDRAVTVMIAVADGRAFGVAQSAATAAGDEIRVVVHGYVEGMLTDDGLASGECFVSDASGLGTSFLATEAYPPLGVTLEADAGTDPYTVDAWIYGLGF